MAMICRTAAQCGPWAFLCVRLSAYGPRCNRWRTTKELASGTPRRRSTSGPRTRSRHSRSDATVRDRGRPDMEYAMASHKFQVGEIVNLRPIVSRNVPGGAYEVTKQLPHSGREFEYRIKSQRRARARSWRKRPCQAIGSGACAIVAHSRTIQVCSMLGTALPTAIRSYACP
jgi:hypothetical protein